MHELQEIAAHCNQRGEAARKVERKMRKVAAAVLLQDKIGEQFNAIVTGATEKGTFARLISPPVDGRVMRGERGLRVGDKTRVRLVSTDPERGFIDFVAGVDRELAPQSGRPTPRNLLSGQRVPSRLPRLNRKNVFRLLPAISPSPKKSRKKILHRIKSNSRNSESEFFPRLGRAE